LIEKGFGAGADKLAEGLQHALASTPHVGVIVGRGAFRGESKLVAGIAETKAPFDPETGVLQASC